ncbi:MULTISPECIES: hypothetical protein [Pseudomonas]|uniref:Uncharacterized protein n=1 Tax=Pseudomonas oryzihabitans TaxID=47885 RepID=A0A1G5PDM5_9PSED|nr:MULTISPECIES: hypothetical protein [Pseudomonas]NMY91794.1 hypothetical protein [Pseudomonas psychrotolerans]NMY91993.1 hypothetical protein [Pseudomonas psychrotolerans]NRH44640.1 hypothetical protein [Pseudomonas sp. MS15a(2019)]SCZ47655.1 hypothetical protein SAMN05216279_11552 [Pseudomonas psychrotolerans]HJE67105.1 hypothetical protein [Pseudomonas oryzihabitans]
MNQENRLHGLDLLERYARQQDHIDCLLRQIEECKDRLESQELWSMLSLCLTENKQNQITVCKAFRFLLELEDDDNQAAGSD